MRQRRPSTRSAICGSSSARMCRYSSKSEGEPSRTVMTLPEAKKLTLRRYLEASLSTEATKEGAVRFVPSSPNRVETMTV